MAQQTRVPIGREITKTRAGDKIQSNAAKAAQAVNNIPTVGSKIIQGVACATGVAIPVLHGLGRPWKGWRLTRIYGWDGTAGQTPQLQDSGHVSDDVDSRVITFGSFAKFTADLEIF